MFQTTNQILVYWRVRDVVWRKASGIPSEEGRQHACTKIRKRGHIGWNLRAEWHVGSNGFTIWLIMFLHMISSSHFSITESCFLDTTPTIYWVMINNAVSIASKWTQKSSNIKNMLCHPKTVYGIIMNIPGTQMVFGHGHWPILIRIMLWNYRPLQMGSLSCPYHVPICHYHGPSQHHPVGLKRSDLWWFVTYDWWLFWGQVPRLLPPCIDQKWPEAREEAILFI